MSRIDELVGKMCPNGVEYKATSDVCKDRFWLMPSTPKYMDKGIPYITSKNVRNNEIDFNNVNYISEDVYQELSKNRSIRKGDLLITMIGTIGEAAFVKDERCFYGQNMYLLRLDDSVIEPMFFYYYLTSKRVKESVVAQKSSSGQGYIKAGSIDGLKIPVPPIKVQQEIVSILNQFMVLTETLIGNLTKEIKNYKMQYEYYRNRLMDIGLDFTKMSLKDIVSTFRGEYITKKSAKQGSIPVILGGQEPAYYIDRANHAGEIVVVARSGVSAGFVSYWDEPIFVTDGFGYEAKKSVVIPKYLYYILKNREKEMNGMKRGAGVPHVSGEALSKLEFPIPPLEIQEQIILVNEKLDNEYNELFVTLEAEIELCQKQYEYYRDKLLTFKEKSC